MKTNVLLIVAFWDDDGAQDLKYASYADTIDEEICVESEYIWVKPKKSNKEICAECHLLSLEKACTKAMCAYASDT